MELVFLALLVITMAVALGSGYPVAFALPGAAIVSIAAASICGYLFAGDSGAYFAQGDGGQWLSAGVLNLRGVYWEVERDTLIAIPLFIFMGIMLQRSKIAEDLLITMAQLFGPVPGGLGISVVFVGALLAATTGIVGATVVATANGTGGEPEIGDYEAMLFGVPKQYRNLGESCYVANEITYSRARGIPVGPGDERRVYGMTHEDYMLHDHPFGIHHGMRNQDAFFFVGRKYRMYRRLGLSIRVETQGETLARDNNVLFVARGRFGGQMEDGAACSVSTSFKL